ncbi:MAG: TonB-dependent receptor [Bacteroidota bacterium]
MGKTIYRLWITLGFVLIFGQLLGQNAIIKGIIIEKESGEAVPFTNVFLKGTSLGSTSDGNGNFAINKIPPGTYTLMMKSMGYDSLAMVVSVKAGEVVTKKIIITKAAFTLTQFSLTAERERSQNETRTSVAYVTPKQIKQMPTIGGTPDLAQYLQILPGVIFTGDQGGQLYIRGGSPIQNKVLLDGMVIYNPFHSIGLFSVFDTDIMKSADVYSGGFGAEYGGRISSIMDVKTREGNKKRVSGKVDVNTFGAKLLIEGPLVKYNEATGSSISYIFSAKNSYLSESSKLLYQYIDTAGLPFNYNDFYGKISMNSANGSKINFFGFNFNDNVKYKSIADFNWTSSGGGMNFSLIPGSTPVIMDGSVAYSKYRIVLDNHDGLPRSSDINGFNIGLGFNYILGKNNIKYGFEMLGFQTNYQFQNSSHLIIQQQENTTEMAGYVKYKGIYGKFILEPSFRGHFYASLSDISFEPRFSMKFNLNDKIRFKLASGIYSQNLISASSERDVVNLFYGFLSGSDQLPDKRFDGTAVSDLIQKSQHVVLGMEWDVVKNLTLNFEGYIKNFSQLTELNQRKIYEDNEANSSKPAILREDFIWESGMAKGADFTAKYELEKVYFWFVYSLGWVDRNDGIIQYPTHFDRRHNINMLVSYRFGGLDQWQFDVRWNYGTGFAFSRTLGNYPTQNFGTNIGGNYTQSNETFGWLYEDTNGGRLPDFHRMDINLKYKYNFTERSILEINLGATNIYNRPNIFYFDRTTKQRVNQLPFMPSIGINWVF